MKFNYRGQIEVEKYPRWTGEKTAYLITRGDSVFETGDFLEFHRLKEVFTPADCEALNLIEPDRTKRLCQIG